MMRTTIGLVLLFLATPSLLAENQHAFRGDLLLIQGDSGTEEYGEKFSTWLENWTAAGESGGFQIVTISPESLPAPQRDLVLTQLKQYQEETLAPLWIVLIGHGTFDGKRAKFNLVGPDLSAREFAQALEDVKRPTVFLNCSASSAPFIAELSRNDRVVVTATRSGDQVSFSHFGEFLSEAINDLSADLDKDEQVSLLEAFLMASRRVQAFYEADGRIPTENALLDDNGDQLGTRSSAFQGLRATATTDNPVTGNESVALDGFRANQLHLVANELDRSLSPEVIAQRNEIEARIENLRLRKQDLPENQYYQQLEQLCLEMAGLLLPDFSNPSTTPKDFAEEPIEPGIP